MNEEQIKRKAKDFVKEYLRDNLILDEDALVQFVIETTKELQEQVKSLEEMLAEQYSDLKQSLDWANEREKELLEQIEKMKCCGNCNNFKEERKLCVYSMGDKSYFCKLRQWELRND